MKQSSHCRVLGAHLHEHLGPEGAKLHVTSKVNQALPVTRWVAKNVGKAEALEHVRSKTSPSALFVAGIEGSDPKWVDVQWRRLMRASLGYEPDDGSCRHPPNVALEEQSGQLPWSQEVRSSNSSLLARLSAAQGPRTMPRELMASMLENGIPHHLSQSAVRFKRRKNKRARSKVASAQKLSIQRQRARCSELPQKSGARLYCELTPGRFPEVANKGAQFRLERQGVGLVPLPEVGSDTCTECGTLTSVAHSAFECPAHTQPREMLLKALDGVCSGLGLGSGHHWWTRSADQKLRASFCPTRGTVPVPLERAFFSRAASAWGAFYEAACRP